MNVEPVALGSGNLLRNLVLFGRLLRGLGLDVNPGRVIDLVDALEHINIGEKQDFYHAARSLLVHKREDIPIFDEAFELFWTKPSDGWTSLDLQGLGGRRRRRPTYSAPPLNQQAEDRSEQGSDRAREGEAPPHIEITLTYSAREVLRHKDFSELTSEELAAIKRLIGGFIWNLGERRTRRTQAGRGRLLDFRRTFRHNLRFGGEFFDLARRKQIWKPRPLVVLADISGSMERYTRLLLHFVYSLAAARTTKIEAFVFGTQLTRVTPKLEGSDVDLVLGRLSRLVPDWSGGTRIGEAIKQFNFDWGRRVLGRRAAVLIISDGWDRGDTELLGAEMARLQRSCYRLIWLNPLLSSPSYEPLTRGIQAALPFIDAFLPVHNLASLEQLAEYLTSLGVTGAPPGRR